MAKDLIIVESPAKAKTISKFLDKKYNIKASMGHIRDLPKKSFGVDIEKDFKPKYVVDNKKRKVVKELKNAASAAEKIYLASDHDREGEAIAWHLVQTLKKELKGKDVYRIIFNEITRTTIRKAIKEPGRIDEKKVESQQARRILDRIVGYNISPVLWKVIAKKLSAGRVQSVALRIICEREKKITDFKPQEYWNIHAQLFKDKLEPFKATLTKWKNKKAKLNNKKETDEIVKHLKNKEFLLSKIKSSSRKIHPSPPYITSTLQQDASRILNFSQKRTMLTAQQLYEGIDIQKGTAGLITYMRTDSMRIAKEALSSCRKLVTERFGKKELPAKTRVFKSKKSAQDAHEAIRPTDPFRTPETMESFLTKDQLKLYTLIWQRFIATQMKPVSLKNKKLTIDIGSAQFEASGSTIIDKGFLKAYPHTLVILGENIDPNYAESDILKCKKLDPEQKFTKPPARFTEASLVKELESKGIGRPSTYAAITNTLRTRKYVELKARKFFPTDLGLTVNKFLVGSFSDFFNVEFTAEMENKLDEIEFGKIEWQKLLRKYHDSLEKLISKVDTKEIKSNLQEKTGIKCEKCGSEMILKWSKNGQFLACSNYPECKNIKNFTRNKEGKIEIKKPEKLDQKCPKCGGDLVIKNGRYGRFIGCSNYPKCKYIKPFTLGIKCPECEDGEITEKRNKRGKYFYSCTNYPKCKFVTNFKPVAVKCPECGNYYMEEHFSKKKDTKYLKCPKCGKTVF